MEGVEWEGRVKMQIRGFVMTATARPGYTPVTFKSRTAALAAFIQGNPPCSAFAGTFCAPPHL